MKLFWVCLLMLFLFYESVEADKVYLKSGDVIVGKIISAEEKISLITTYGEISINLKDITTIVAGEVRLKDGSILRGNFGQEQLRMETGFGEININWADVDSIVFTEAKKPARPEPVLGQRQYLKLGGELGLALPEDIGKTLAFGSSAGYSFSPQIEIEVGINYWAKTLLYYFEFSDLSIEGNIISRILYTPEGPFALFLGGGVGLHMFSVEFFRIRKTTNKMGFQLFTGGEYALSPSLAVFAKFKLIPVITETEEELETFNIFHLTGGITLKLGGSRF